MSCTYTKVRKTFADYEKVSITKRITNIYTDKNNNLAQETWYFPLIISPDHLIEIQWTQKSRNCIRHAHAYYIHMENWAKTKTKICWVKKFNQKLNAAILQFWRAADHNNSDYVGNNSKDNHRQKKSGYNGAVAVREWQKKTGSTATNKKKKCIILLCFYWMYFRLSDPQKSDSGN